MLNKIEQVQHIYSGIANILSDMENLVLLTVHFIWWLIFDNKIHVNEKVISKWSISHKIMSKSLFHCLYHMSIYVQDNWKNNEAEWNWTA